MHLSSRWSGQMHMEQFTLDVSEQVSGVAGWLRRTSHCISSARARTHVSECSSCMGPFPPERWSAAQGLKQFRRAVCGHQFLAPHSVQLTELRGGSIGTKTTTLHYISRPTTPPNLQRWLSHLISYQPSTGGGHCSGSHTAGWALGSELCVPGAVSEHEALSSGPWRTTHARQCWTWRCGSQGQGQRQSPPVHSGLG